MKNNNIYFVFQPIILNNEVYGYEALMRFKDNTCISEYIDSLKSPMDYYELEKQTFFLALKEYKKRGYTEKVFINTFPNVFLKAKDMEEVANEFGDILDRVVFEVLERPIANQDSLKKKIAFAKKHGCLLAIDDFGTGNHVIDSELLLKPDIIKFDRSLVANINKSKIRQKKLKNLINKFSKANIIVLAEGVETKEEFHCMKKLGAKLFQGFYICRPN